jgi:hypothetical protein
MKRKRKRQAEFIEMLNYGETNFDVDMKIEKIKILNADSEGSG